MSYIPALAWSGSFRLASITGDDRRREKPRREMQAFLSGTAPAIAEPYLLTSLAGHLATAVLARVGAASQDPKYGAAAGRLLTSYTESLGLTEALTYLPDHWPDRVRVLEIYRTHVRALVTHQSDDGSWRHVVDEPTSYRELTVTAMTTAAVEVESLRRSP